MLCWYFGYCTIYLGRFFESCFLKDSSVEIVGPRLGFVCVWFVRRVLGGVGMVVFVGVSVGVLCGVGGFRRGSVEVGMGFVWCRRLSSCGEERLMLGAEDEDGQGVVGSGLL